MIRKGWGNSIVFKYVFMLSACIFFLSSCEEGVLDPGEVASPLAGNYTLESRSFIAQDSASTLLDLLEPPGISSTLVLGPNGRYGQIDSIFTGDSLRVFTETGRWSVFGSDFFIESDDSRFATEQFTYDGVRLTRTLPDIPRDSNIIGSPLFSIIDIWVILP
jgi:hypothetical protein